MTEPLDRVLQLVAEGKLTADEAAPILEALDRQQDTGSRPANLGPAQEDVQANGSGTPPRWARIEVRESGRRVVDLRVPISLGRFALSRVPGLSREQVSEVEQAVMSGSRGPILDVEDPDGDGVRIVLE